jgi:hypothetical protein
MLLTIMETYHEVTMEARKFSRGREGAGRRPTPWRRDENFSEKFKEGKGLDRVMNPERLYRLYCL